MDVLDGKFRNGMEHIQIRLRRDSDGWPPFETEEIDAEEIGDHTYRICAPPAFARRLAVGDVVTTRCFGHSPTHWVESIVESSGNSTLRIIVRRGTSETDVLDMLGKLGLQPLPTALEGMFVIDVPADRTYAPVRARLLASQAAGEIDFEEGAVSGKHDYVEGQ
jgi:hypothetical protein